MLEQILSFLTASILLTISPGPDIIYVLVQSMTNGKRAGLLTTLGLVSGILVHTSLVAFGVSAIIRQSETLFLIIKIIGALYLIFLAYKVFKSDAEFSLASPNLKTGKDFKLFKQGFIMNVLNPKVTIFFLAFFPGFIWNAGDSLLYQFYFLGFLFMFQAMVIFGLVALLAGNISMYLKSHPSSGFYLKWLQIIVFLLIAILILF